MLELIPPGIPAVTARVNDPTRGFGRLRWAIACLVVIILSHGSYADAGAADPPANVERLRYDFMLDGKSAGAINVLRQATTENGSVATDIETQFEMKIKVALFAYHFRSTSHALLGPHGLVRFSSNIEEDGKQRRIVAQRRDDTIDVEHLSGTDRRAWHFGAPEFDATSAEFSEYDHATAGSTARMRVLDLEAPALQNVLFDFIGEDVVVLDGLRIPCWVIRFKSKAEQGERCVAKDGLGHFLVREEGRTPDGPYKITVTLASPVKRPRP